MSGQDVLLRARQHFRLARTVETLQSVAVPEWDTTLHYWPEMSLEERRAIYAHMRPVKDRGVALDELLAASVTQVLVRSRDAYGVRLFKESDADALADADPSVIQRIAGEMGWGGGSVEDAEKN